MRENSSTFFFNLETNKKIIARKWNEKKIVTRDCVRKNLLVQNIPDEVLFCIMVKTRLAVFFFYNNPLYIVFHVEIIYLFIYLNIHYFGFLFINSFYSFIFVNLFIFVYLVSNLAIASQMVR